MVWPYLDGGAEDERTLRDNVAAYQRWRFVPRVLKGVGPVDTAAVVAGQRLAFPVLLAPTGLSGLAHSEGELSSARAAESVETRAIISTAASYSIEEVAQATDQPHLFQLYPWINEATGARELTKSLIRRARQSGYCALVVTVDSPAMGNRESERRRGMGAPPVLTPRRVLETAAHPRWAWGFVSKRRISARNLLDDSGLRAGVASVRMQIRFMRPDLVWDDLAWMRDEWEGLLYVKGILDADDAERAVDLGADGVIVSNHGGRQLDSAIASLDALPAVVERVGTRCEVLIDGGIRRGSDVVKALALGARAVCIGRPHLWGLAACGQAGVEGVLTILRDEIVRVMTLLGAGSAGDLDRSCLVQAGQRAVGTADQTYLG